MLLAAVDAIEQLWLHAVEGLLQLFLRNGSDVAQIDEAAAEDELSIFRAPRD